MDERKYLEIADTIKLKNSMENNARRIETALGKIENPDPEAYDLFSIQIEGAGYILMAEHDHLVKFLRVEANRASDKAEELRAKLERMTADGNH